MLMRTDPFRELDRLTQQLAGTAARPAAMAMDAYRQGDSFVVQFDLPGVDPASIDVDVERNVLSVRAERKPPAGEDVQLLANERPTGTFSRQLFLGEALDTERVEASYDAGVLSLRIPVAEKAKPRKISSVARADPRPSTPDGHGRPGTRGWPPAVGARAAAATVPPRDPAAYEQETGHDQCCGDPGRRRARHPPRSYLDRRCGGHHDRGDRGP